MRTNYLRHLANTVELLWSRPVWGGGGQLPIELVGGGGQLRIELVGGGGSNSQLN